MGLPINSYKLFEAIANNDERLLKNHFNVDFKLFAILLHDPNSNSKFEKAVCKSFYNWSLNTRNDLFFSTLADPPQSWIDLFREEKGQLFGGDLTYNKLFDPTEIYKTYDSSLTALFISEFLGIPFQKLPVIIFTSNLNQSSFYWMATGASTINKQIKWLSKIPKDFNSPLIQGLKVPVKINKVNIDRNFSNLLIEICQKISKLDTANYLFEPSQGFWEDKNKINQKEIELSLFFEGIRQVAEIRGISRNKYNAEKDSYCLNEEREKYCIVELPPSKEEIIEELALKNFAGFEKESFLFFRQGFQLISTLNSIEVYDFSPFILPFAKSFEKEISYSIVHWVRKNYDIILPRYFYEYQPGINAKVVLRKNSFIDFNQIRNDIWVSPTLGGQISGFKKTVNNFSNHPFESDSEYQDFLNQAYQIKNIRNRACHSERTTRSDFDKILSCWKTILEKGYFETLAKLKKEFRGLNK